jgi:hypothetical protein
MFVHGRIVPSRMSMTATEAGSIAPNKKPLAKDGSLGATQPDQRSACHRYHNDKELTITRSARTQLLTLCHRQISQRVKHNNLCMSGPLSALPLLAAATPDF